MDITRLKGLEVGQRLTIRLPEQKGSLEWEAIVIVEGWSTIYNCLYVRILHGKTIGTRIDGLPGSGFACIRHTDLNGYKVYLSGGGQLISA